MDLEEKRKIIKEHLKKLNELDVLMEERIKKIELRLQEDYNKKINWGDEEK